jgi:hypothetical protein
VLAALPSPKDLPVPPVRLYGPPPRTWSRLRILAATAAALVLAAAGALLLFSFAGSKASAVPVAVLKGHLEGSSGQEVKALEAGQTYRVADGEDVVLAIGDDTKVRLLPETRFEALAGEADALRLRDGSLYAAQPGEQVFRIEGPTFETEIIGVSLVMQAEPRAGDPPESEGHGLVLVFKGQARVHNRQTHEPVTVSEGQMFYTGLGTERVQTFLEDAENRAHMLETVRDVPGHRKLYADAVRHYQEDLRRFDAQLPVADSERRAELLDRRTRVKQLLEQHQRRLATMAGGEGLETPAQRAKRVRRAFEEVQRAEEAYSDPGTWL